MIYHLRNMSKTITTICIILFNFANTKRKGNNSNSLWKAFFWITSKKTLTPCLRVSEMLSISNILPHCPLEGDHAKCILMCAKKRAAQLKPDWKSDLFPNVTRTSWDNDWEAMHQYSAGSLILTLTDALSTEILIEWIK